MADYRYLEHTAAEIDQAIEDEKKHTADTETHTCAEEKAAWNGAVEQAKLNDERLTALETDTGWVDCGLASNLTATSSTVQYRKLGSLVQIKGNFVPSAFNEPAQHYSNCFTIATGLRPSSAVYGMCNYGDYTAGLTMAACNISSNGIISVFLDSNTTVSDIIGKTVRINLIYFVD